MKHALRLGIAVAVSAAAAIACSPSPPPAGRQPLPRTMFVQTFAQLTHILQTGKRSVITLNNAADDEQPRDVAVVNGNNLMLVDAVEQQGSWAPRIRWVARDGSKHASTATYLLPGSPAHSAKMHIWMVDSSPVVYAVGAAFRNDDSTSYSVDIFGPENPAEARRVDMGRTNGADGDIHIALSSGGQIAILLGGSSQMRLITADKRLMVSSDLSGDLGGCLFADASRSDSTLPYVLCQDANGAPSTAAHLMYVDAAGSVHSVRLPGTFANDLVSSAANGEMVYIGNAADDSVSIVNLRSGRLQARETLKSQASRSFSPLRASTADARQVVFQTVAIDRQLKMLYFLTTTDAWCLSIDTLGERGHRAGSDITTMAIDTVGHQLLIADGSRVSGVNLSDCQSTGATMTFELPAGEPIVSIVP